MKGLFRDTAQVPVLWIWVAGLLGVGLLVTTGVMGLHVVAARRHLEDYGALVNELDALRRQNVVVQELEAELRELRRLQQRLLLLAGVETGLGSDSTGFVPEPAPPSGGSELLYWPVRGEILRDYSATHPAMDISAPLRRAVLSAGEGVVIGQEDLRELGPMVLVQHGDSLQTMYANAEITLVAVGDRVRAGQAIALVGHGHEGALSHLHFQVLRSGRPVDPRDWVPELFPY